MAAYREHVSVSSLIGVFYAAVAAAVLGFTWVQALLAGVVTAVGGMLPDLDAQNGKPAREMFALTAAAAPLVLMQTLLAWGGDAERAMLFGVIVYFAVRYGGASLLAKVSVHRGMFHSVPAMVIAAEIVFLGYRSRSVEVKLLMAVGVAVGFFSHLLLDEAYSVGWDGAKLKLKKSAGTAIKFASKSQVATSFTYGLLLVMSYATLAQWSELQLTEPTPTMPTEELKSAPLYRPSDSSSDSFLRSNSTRP